MNSKEEIQKLRSMCFSNGSEEELSDASFRSKSKKLKSIQISQIDQIKDRLSDFNSTKEGLEQREFIKSNQTSSNLERECQRLKESMQRQPLSSQKQSAGGELKENNSKYELTNQYKRAKNTDKNLQEYQQKYAKLERNFKRFTDNLQHKNQNCSQNLDDSLQNFDIQNCSISPITSQKFPYQPNPAPSLANQISIIDQESDIIMGCGSVLQELPVDALKGGPRKFQSVLQSTHNASMMNLDASQSERIVMLKQVAFRMQQFVKLALERLITLSVSKQQEGELKELMKTFNKSMASQNQRIIDFCQSNYLSTCADKDSKDEKSFIDQECDQVSEMFFQCLQCLQESFQKIIARIYQVDSETFKNYKFKDAIQIFELIIQESHRFSFHEMIPGLTSALLKLRLQVLDLWAVQFDKRQRQKEIQRSFTSWRLNAGLKYYLTEERRIRTMKVILKRQLKQQSRFDALKAVSKWKLSLKSNQSSESMDGQLLLQLLETELNKCLQVKTEFEIFEIVQQAAKQILKCTLQVCLLSDLHKIQICSTSSMKAANLKDHSESFTSKASKKPIFANGFKESRSLDEQIDTCSFASEEENNLMIIPIGDFLFRFYSKVPFNRPSSDKFQLISKAITVYLLRIFELRNQLQSSSTALTDKEVEYSILQADNTLQESILTIVQSISNCSTLPEASQLIELQVSRFLKAILPEAFLRQIIVKDSDGEEKYLLKEREGAPIIKVKENQEEAVEEDVIEERSESLLVQIQTQFITENSSMKMIVHRAEKNAEQWQLEKREKDYLQYLGFSIQYILNEFVFKNMKYEECIQQQQVELQNLTQQNQSLLNLSESLIFPDQKFQHLQDLQNCITSELSSAIQAFCLPLNLSITSLSVYLNQNLISGFSALEEASLIHFQEGEFETNNTNEDLKEEGVLGISKIVVQKKTGDQELERSVVVPQGEFKDEAMLYAEKELIVLTLPIQQLFGSVLAVLKLKMKNNLLNSLSDSSSSYLEQGSQLLTQRLRSFLEQVHQASTREATFQRKLAAYQGEMNEVLLDVDSKDKLLSQFVIPLIKKPDLNTLGQVLYCFGKNEFNLEFNEILLRFQGKAKSLFKHFSGKEEEEEESQILYQDENLTLKVAFTSDKEDLTSFKDLISPFLSYFFENLSTLLEDSLIKQRPLVYICEKVLNRNFNAAKLQAFNRFKELKQKQIVGIGKCSIFQRFKQQVDLAEQNVYSDQFVQEPERKEITQVQILEVFIDKISQKLDFLEAIAIRKNKTQFQNFCHACMSLPNFTFEQKQKLRDLSNLQQKVLLRFKLYEFFSKTNSLKFATNIKIRNQFRPYQIGLKLKNIFQEFASKEFKISEPKQEQQKLSPAFKIFSLVFQSLISMQSQSTMNKDSKGLQFVKLISNDPTKLAQIQRKIESESEYSQISVDFKHFINECVAIQSFSEDIHSAFNALKGNQLPQASAIQRFQTKVTYLRQIKDINKDCNCPLKLTEGQNFAKMIMIQKATEQFINYQITKYPDLFRSLPNAEELQLQVIISPLTAAQKEAKKRRKEHHRQLHRPKLLSQFLSQVFFHGPSELQADNVLPILILDQQLRGAEEDFDLEERRLAFFYQFKDNYIYNFDYSDTFIEELTEMGYVLELSSKSEDALSDCSDDDESSSKQCIVEQYSHSKKKQGLFGNYLKREMRNEGGKKDKVRSVTNEEYSHILYYPVSENGNVIAVLEVGYHNQFEEGLLSSIEKEKVEAYLERFKHSLISFRNQLGLFCSKSSAVIDKKSAIAMQNAFGKFKQNCEDSRKEEFMENQRQQQEQQNERNLSEYVNNLESYDQELRKLVQEKSMLTSECETLQGRIDEMNLEKDAKLKFLASALLFCTLLERRAKASELKATMNRWRNNVHLQKIAESAFNKVLELNHKHSFARFKGGCYLMKQVVKRANRKDRRKAFKQLLQFVKFNSLKQQALLQYQPSLNKSQNFSQIDQTHLFGNILGNLNTPNATVVCQNQQAFSSLGKSNSVQKSFELGHGQSLYHPYPSQHSLSMAAQDVPSQGKRSKSRKR